MKRSCKFRLYPNKNEEERLFATLEVCRNTYNRLLFELNLQERPNKKELSVMLPVWKREYPELAGVYSKCLQPEVKRLFSNLWSLAQSKRKGRKVGRLRYKGKRQFKSFTYNQSGFKIVETSTRLSLLHLSKIGDIPMYVHHPIEGKVKQVSVKHMSSGEWFAFIQVDDGLEVPEYASIKKAVGIDLGLKSLLVDSDGHRVDNPRWMKRSLKKLRREQRRLSRTMKGSKNRDKQRIKVAKIHRDVVYQRDDYIHKISRYYVDNYDLIVTEDLNIYEMMKDNKYRLQGNILDACWGRLNTYLSYKAESAGKTYLRTNPYRTSQDCSRCGTYVYKELSERMHCCPECGLTIGRDLNASKNIYIDGLRKVGLGQAELTPVDTMTSTNPIEGCKSWWLKQEAPSARVG